MFCLHTFTTLAHPDLIFLSETQIFSSDLNYCMSLFRGEYSWKLNSEEKLDPQSLLCPRAGQWVEQWSCGKNLLPNILLFIQLQQQAFFPLFTLKNEYVHFPVVKECFKSVETKFPEILDFPQFYCYFSYF